MRFVTFASLLLLLISCPARVNPKPDVDPAASKPPSIPVYGYEIVETYPHDPAAFTEGLFYWDGFLYESTGLYGESSLRKVEIETGKVLKKVDMSSTEFGEGISLVNGKIFQLTYRERLCHVYSAKTFKKLKAFNYQGEGWGMTTDGSSLYMTQGTNVIKVIDPETFEHKKSLAIVQADGKPLRQINELEWVNGEIWANIWHSEKPKILGKRNYVARIEAATGKLLGWIDLDGISPQDQGSSGQYENSLNGIAYDAQKNRIFVTGKNWKHLYEIKLKIKAAPPGLSTGYSGGYLNRPLACGSAV